MNCCCNLTRNSPAAIPVIVSSSSSRARASVSRRPHISLCFNPFPSPQNFTSPSTFFPSFLKNSENLDSSSSSTTTHQVRHFTSLSAARSLLHHNYSSSTCGGFHRCIKANRVCPPTYFPTLQNKIGILQYKNNYYSHMGARVRFFSTGSTRTSWENNGGGREKDSTTLPWITATAYKKERQQGKVGQENKDRTTQNHSSWEISAERYFSRNNTNSPKIVTEKESRNTSLVENKRNISNGKLDGRGKEIPPHSRKRIIDNRREQQHSSSERSYLSRNGSSSSSKLSKENNRGNRDARVVNQELRRNNTVGAQEENRGGKEEAVEVDMKDDDPVNDPTRWDGIKSNYGGGFMDDREYSRFEKQPEEVRHWNMQDNWGKKTWKEATESSVPRMVGQGVYGVGPVLAALTMGRREFYALYTQQGLELGGNNRKNKKEDKKGVEKVFNLAERMGLKVIESSKHDLNMVVDNRPHQGLVLDASPLELVNIKELEPPPEGQKAPLWIALDEVTDPQNLGAIVRSSYFFGVEGVVLCAKNSAPLSGVVSKASAGSLELIELRSCKNMMQFLSSSTENGWRVLGGSVSSRALPLSTVEAGMPTILVLGSEGTGLRPLVERSCTQLIRIPGNMSTISGCAAAGEIELEPEMVVVDQTHSKSSFLAVESLNVSVAAGVLLYHLVGSNTHLPDDTKPDITYEVPKWTGSRC